MMREGCRRADMNPPPWEIDTPTSHHHTRDQCTVKNHSGISKMSFLPFYYCQNCFTVQEWFQMFQCRAPAQLSALASSSRQGGWRVGVTVQQKQPWSLLEGVAGAVVGAGAAFLCICCALTGQLHSIYLLLQFSCCTLQLE